MRIVPAVIVLCLAAGMAAAQERDLFDAANQAAAVREKQAAQMKRAGARITNPITLEPATEAGGTVQRARTERIEAPRDAGGLADHWPWALLVAVVAVAVHTAMRASGAAKRADRWSDLPGHQGLRAGSVIDRDAHSRPGARRDDS